MITDWGHSASAMSGCPTWSCWHEDAECPTPAWLCFPSFLTENPLCRCQKCPWVCHVQMSHANSSVINPLDGLQRRKLRMTGPEFSLEPAHPQRTEVPCGAQNLTALPPRKGPVSLLRKPSVPFGGDKNKASGAWSQWGSSPLWDTQDMFFRILLGIVLWSDCGLILRLKKRMWRGGFPCLRRLLDGHPQFTETAPA